MVFVGKFLLVALASVTAAAPAAAALVGASTIVADIQSIDTSVNALHTATANWDGGILGLLSITADLLAVHLTNRNTYVDGLLTSNFNSADSASINVPWATLATDITSAVQVIIAKKPQFAALGQTVVVESSLQLLKSDHDTLSALLIGKISADAVPKFQASVTKIDNAIQSGINAFAS
jgi:hypothetical protein